MAAVIDRSLIRPSTCTSTWSCAAVHARETVANRQNRSTEGARGPARLRRTDARAQHARRWTSSGAIPRPADRSPRRQVSPAAMDDTSPRRLVELLKAAARTDLHRRSSLPRPPAALGTRAPHIGSSSSTSDRQEDILRYTLDPAGIAAWPADTGPRRAPTDAQWGRHRRLPARPERGGEARPRRTLDLTGPPPRRRPNPLRECCWWPITSPHWADVQAAACSAPDLALGARPTRPAKFGGAPRMRRRRALEPA